MNIGLGKNYVINLKTHKERKEHALDLLGNENTIFIEAFDGQDYIGDNTWLKENLSPTVIDPNGWWTIDIICCALSHRKAWKAFLDSGDETACLFSDDIVKNMANKAYTLGVFLDIEKAYDMVWKKGVLFKLNNMGIGGNLFN